MKLQSNTRHALWVLRDLVGINFEDCVDIPGVGWLTRLLTLPLIAINLTFSTFIAVVVMLVATVVSLGAMPVLLVRYHRANKSLKRMNSHLRERIAVLLDGKPFPTEPLYRGEFPEGPPAGQGGVLGVQAWEASQRREADQ